MMHIEPPDPNPSTLQLLSPITLQSLSSPPTAISVYDILSPSTPLFASLSIPLFIHAFPLSSSLDGAVKRGADFSSLTLECHSQPLPSALKVQFVRTWLPLEFIHSKTGGAAYHQSNHKLLLTVAAIS